ncbi:MAG: RNA-binding S4 domain-containing protein [Alphaproteobacteria bacterium]
MSEPRLRVDKWLWQARFFKSRTRASALCAAGRLRVGGQVVTKAHHPVGPGDVLTFPMGSRIRVVRILALGGRRGPAAEAALLYEDLSPVPAAKKTDVPHSVRARGSGRPTKADRRAITRLKGDD